MINTLNLRMMTRSYKQHHTIEMNHEQKDARCGKYSKKKCGICLSLVQILHCSTEKIERQLLYGSLEATYYSYVIIRWRRECPNI